MAQITTSNRVFSTKVKFFKVILGLLVIIWMLIIFNFSAQNAKTSSATSTVITEKVVGIVVKNYNNLSDLKQQKVFGDIQFFVRKTAHFSEYAILGILIWLLAMTYSIPMKYKVTISFVISTIYAITDEFHQTFAAGRSAQIRDVCIDSLGALSGILIVTLITILYRARVHEKLLK